LEFSTIKGFKDILPEEVGPWQRLEQTARRVFHCFGYREIKTPLLERTELFSRSIGEETDIVSKEMYTFHDSKGRGMTLRPEATASLTRAYIQNRLYHQSPVQKLFTIGPMFRHEQPQKGRFRQFHQIDAEIFGDPGPMSDAELILMAMEILRLLDLEGLTLAVNSLGCPECRPGFRSELSKFLAQKTGALCDNCTRRARTNPLRIFDCKVPACGQAVAGAPSVLDFCCEACRAHFKGLQGYLEEAQIPFRVDHRLVRGLDYYTRTAFEIQTDLLGAQNAVVGGGRYDQLTQQLGGPDRPAIGFAMGMERVVALMERRGEAMPERPDLFICALGTEAGKAAFVWMTDLRRSGFWVEMDYSGKGLKAQMKRAHRLGARRALIVGEDELAAGKAVLRDMDNKRQEEVALEGLTSHLQQALRQND